MKKVFMLALLVLGTTSMINAQTAPAKTVAPAKEVKHAKKAKADKKMDAATPATPAKK